VRDIIDYTNWFVHTSFLNLVMIVTVPVATDVGASRTRKADEIIARALVGPLNAETTDGFRTIREPLVLAGLVGRGIQASRTPLMHAAEGARIGIAYEYRLIDFDKLALGDADFPLLISAARRAGYAGLNITHPFKQQVIGCIDALAPEADAIGAVNTVAFREGLAVGHNTDFFGFTEAFRREMPGADLSNVILIGAGGAGMAVARALTDLGADDLAVVDLDQAKAQRLVDRLGRGRAVSTSDLDSLVAMASGLVNASPIGMSKYPGSPVDTALLRPEMWVADIIYFPAETELLKKARAVGCRTTAGAGMAVFQAVRAFEIITGRSPETDAMAAHFHSWEY
jgi:shikimate dehydrogenase